jgi:hypothetical protein
MSRCRYYLDDGQEAICLGCRTKFEALEAENVRLKRDLALMRQERYKQRDRLKVEIVRKMGKPQRKR